MGKKREVEQRQKEEEDEKGARELDTLAQHTTPQLAAWFKVRGQVLEKQNKISFAGVVAQAGTAGKFKFAAAANVVTADHAPMLGSHPQ